MSNGKVIKDIVTIKHEYPNIKKFLENIGIKVFFSDKEKLSIGFIDDEEIDAAEREFHKAVTQKIDAEYIPSLEIGPNPVIYEYFKNDKDFRLKIFQELLDFDKFLEH